MTKPRAKINQPDGTVLVARMYQNVVLGYEVHDAHLARKRAALQASLRIREIEKIIAARHGPEGADTADAVLYLRPAFDHLINRARASVRPRDTSDLATTCRRWAMRWAPAAGVDEVEAVIEAALERAQLYKADRLAAVLRVTQAERTALGLRTIGAINEDETARKAARKRREAERKAQGRKVDRETYEGSSIADLARRAGCTRKTVHAHLKAGDAVAFLVSRGVHDAERRIAAVRPEYVDGLQVTGPAQYERSSWVGRRTRNPGQGSGRGHQAPRPAGADDRMQKLQARLSAVKAELTRERTERAADQEKREDLAREFEALREAYERLEASHLAIITFPAPPEKRPARLRAPGSDQPVFIRLDGRHRSAGVA